MTSSTELRSVCTPPDRVEQLGVLSPSSPRDCSGEREVGTVPASRIAVRYRAENLVRAQVADFDDPEAALRWCGLELSWSHYKLAGRTTLIGSDARGQACAVVRGPLLAVLPECCKVEVIA